jgi:hypothetical protein
VSIAKSTLPNENISVFASANHSSRGSEYAVPRADRGRKARYRRAAEVTKEDVKVRGEKQVGWVTIRPDDVLGVQVDDTLR